MIWIQIRNTVLLKDKPSKFEKQNLEKYLKWNEKIYLYLTETWSIVIGTGRYLNFLMNQFDNSIPLKKILLTAS